MKDTVIKFKLASNGFKRALEKMDFAVTMKMLTYISYRERNLN